MWHMDYSTVMKFGHIYGNIYIGPMTIYLLAKIYMFKFQYCKGRLFEIESTLIYRLAELNNLTQARQYMIPANLDRNCPKLNKTLSEV